MSTACGRPQFSLAPSLQPNSDYICRHLINREEIKDLHKIKNVYMIIITSILTNFHLHISCVGSWLRVPWSAQQCITYYWGSASIPKSATYPHEIQVKFVVPNSIIFCGLSIIQMALIWLPIMSKDFNNKDPIQLLRQILFISFSQFFHRP